MQNQPFDAPTVVLVSTVNIEDSLHSIRQAIPELETLKESLCEQDPRFEQVSEILRCAVVAEEWISREIEGVR